MGKRRIEKIQKIENASHRKVTYCKRKKGLLKKSIELSILCDLNMFLYIYDEKSDRVIHYASDPNLDLMELFNKKAQREYYTNSDYLRVGGKSTDLNPALRQIVADDSSDEEIDDCISEPEKRGPKIFSSKRKDGQVSSRIGTLLDQKLPIPEGVTQNIEFKKEGQTVSRSVK